MRPTRLPVNISKRGKQRERGGEHEQHAERSRDRGAVEEADAEREHAEQRDHDRGAGEEDRPSGRVHRQLERALHVAAVLAVGVAEARDDEEGVVDADAEPDHQRELGGEVDHVDEVAAEPDHAEAGAEAEERRHDRQAHREQRAEAEQQDDHGGQEADSGREADARLLGLLDRLAAELDLQGGRARGLGRRDHAVDRRLRQLVRALVELDGGEADRARLRDGVRAGRVGAHDAGDVRQTRDAHEQRRDHRARRRVGELAVRRPEDDLVGVAGLRREAALEQVDRALRVGVRKREVVRVPLADRLRDGEDADGEDDPGDDDDPAMCDRPAGQLQHR